MMTTAVRARAASRSRPWPSSRSCSRAAARARRRRQRRHRRPPRAARRHGAAVPPTGYVIGPDDVLSIVFWRDKDMSADVTVRPDGKISLPLLNDIQAAGPTPDQLRDAHQARRRRPSSRIRTRRWSSRRSTAARCSSPARSTSPARIR